MDRVYLDHAASTPLLPTAWEAMRPYALEHAGNPASSHAAGRAARRALEDARECVAACLGAEPGEVVFTSGATEANNLALFGLATAPPASVIVSDIEHPSVLEPVNRLVERGWRRETPSVDAAGVTRLPNAADVRLATLMLVNHETGAVQPVRELAARLPGVSVHCDAAAAVGKLPIRFHELGVATLTLSAHKFHGPKGIGVLLVRRGTRLEPQLFGGHQQHGKRPGTESAFLAVGLATALGWACDHLSVHAAHVLRLRERFLSGLTAAKPIVVNGDGIPHIANVAFPGVQADALLMALDLAGVACSTGSACSSGSLLPSPVLRSMNVDDAVLRSAMRFSFSPLTTEAEVDLASKRIINIVKDLRTS
jgi:cysteine desulfurase